MPLASFELGILIKMLYSFIFFHTTIQVNDPDASLSNTINKKPCKTQPKLAPITKLY
jgi:hypothetical protein